MDQGRPKLRRSKGLIALSSLKQRLGNVGILAWMANLTRHHREMFQEGVWAAASECTITWREVRQPGEIYLHVSILDEKRG
jgi:hypothetical protein